MNAEQKRAVAMALQFVRDLKPDDHGPSPSDNWTDEDWAILRKANPLAPQMDAMVRGFVDTTQKTEFDKTSAEITDQLLSGESPFSVSKGCWGIIEDAINRRRFFESPVSKVLRSIFKKPS